MNPTNKIKFANTIEVGIDAVTQKWGFLARSGAGKSFACGVLIEGMLKNDAQVIVLDPVGIHYGLRLAADGKSPGFSIPVFGGEHGDLPLTETSGAMIADLLVDRHLSAVLDVSGFTKNKRKLFVADFAEHFFHRKKTARSPVHLVIEEAQVFAPQQCDKGEERMLGAIEDVCRLGRNYGIGTSLISQRPQSVSKEVLNQVEVLVALQTNGVQERRAIRDWVNQHASDATQGVGAVDAVLPTLAIGEALLWSPQWLKRFERVKIGKKTTYDSSSTPDFSTVTRVSPTPLSEKELLHLRSQIEEVVKESESTDPKRLQKRIRELEAELKKHPETTRVETKVETKIEKVSVPVFNTEEILPKLQELQTQVATVVEAQERLHKMLNDAVERGKALAADTRVARIPALPLNRTDEKVVERLVARAKPKEVARKLPTKQTNSDTKLNKGAREMLKALRSRHPQTLSKTQVATLAGLSPNSGTFSNYLSILRTGDFIAGTNDALLLTERGVLETLDVSSAMTSEEVLSLWLSKLTGGARRMLDALVKEPGLDKELLGERVGITPTSGTFSNYLSILKTNALIEARDGFLYPADVFVEE